MMIFKEPKPISLYERLAMRGKIINPDEIVTHWYGIEVYRIPALAKILGCSKRTITHHLQKGKYPAVKYNGKWVMLKTYVDLNLKKSDEEVEYYVTDMVGDIRIRSFINQEVVHEDRRNL
jgi:hypothetical protein